MFNLFNGGLVNALSDTNDLRKILMTLTLNFVEMQVHKCKVISSFDHLLFLLIILII